MESGEGNKETEAESISAYIHVLYSITEALLHNDNVYSPIEYQNGKQHTIYVAIQTICIYSFNFSL